MATSIINCIHQMALTGFKRAIHYAISSFCNEQEADGIAWPANKKIAQRAGCSISTVKKYKKELIEEGYWSQTFRKHDNGRQTTNLYEFGFQKNFEETGRKIYSDVNPDLYQKDPTDQELTELKEIQDIVLEIEQEFCPVDKPVNEIHPFVDNEGGRGRGTTTSKDNHNFNINPIRLVRAKLVDKWASPPAPRCQRPSTTGFNNGRRREEVPTKASDPQIRIENIQKMHLAIGNVVNSPPRRH
jgi:hypothetical protein